MANNKHGQGYNTTGDVARQVPNGGVGSRAAKVPPLPQVQMPTQGPGATPTTGSTPSAGGDAGALHRSRFPAQPQPPRRG
jgi:hypothetical protein